MNTNKENCCGCGACALRCQQKAIEMQCDEEGFLYPIVKKEFCIGCGECERVCLYQNDNQGAVENNVWVGFSNSREVLNHSSSGGVFFELAKKVLEEGGCIVGASYTDSFEVQHIVIDKVEDLVKLSGSKYVQSEMMDILNIIKINLKKNRKVLFSGTPCQGQAVLNYLGANNSNLIIVSIICYGVPSPRIWEMYKKYIIDLHRCKSIKSINFRKKIGNGQNAFLEIAMDKGIYKRNSCDDIYCIGFYENLFLRPSCHSCKVKMNSLYGDIILGDAWGGEYLIEGYEGNGANTVIINSDKGEDLLKSIADRVELFHWNIEEVRNHNPMLYKSAVKSPYRDLFWSEVRKGNSLFCAVMKNKNLPSISEQHRVDVMYHLINQYLYKKVNNLDIIDETIGEKEFERWGLYAKTELMNVLIDDAKRNNNVEIVAIGDMNIKNLEKLDFHRKLDFIGMVTAFKEGDIDRIVVCSPIHDGEIKKLLIDEGVSERNISIITEMIQMEIRDDN